MENLPLPNEIVLQILGYLSLGELIQCARVSKRLSKICEDKSLSYRSNMQVMKDLTMKDRKSLIDRLIANPKVTEVKNLYKIDFSKTEEILAYYLEKRDYLFAPGASGPLRAFAASFLGLETSEALGAPVIYILCSNIVKLGDGPYILYFWI